jgi:rRNA maturation RNase YbeY
MLEIEIIVGDEVSGILPVNSRRLETYARDVLAGNGAASGECNIVFIGDGFMTELNETYKGRTGTTDVLSFNLTDELSDGFCGEVYVSLNRAKAQAEEQGVPFDEEVVRLVTHGLLHLAGHLHDTDDAYASMTVKTDELVKAFFAQAPRIMHFIIRGPRKRGAR